MRRPFLRGAWLQSRAVLASEIGAVVNKTPFEVVTLQKGDALINFDCRLLKSQKDNGSANKGI